MQFNKTVSELSTPSSLNCYKQFLNVKPNGKNSIMEHNNMLMLKRFLTTSGNPQFIHHKNVYIMS